MIESDPGRSEHKNELTPNASLSAMFGTITPEDLEHTNGSLVASGGGFLAVVDVETAAGTTLLIT